MLGNPAESESGANWARRVVSEAQEQFDAQVRFVRQLRARSENTAQAEELLRLYGSICS